MGISAFFITIADNAIATFIGAILFAAIVALARKRIYGAIKGAVFWVSNKEISISNIDMRFSLENGSSEKIDTFLKQLNEPEFGFTVNKVEDDYTRRYILTNQNRNIDLEIDDAPVDDIYEPHSGIRLHAAMRDIPIPYRSGLSALTQILPKFQRCVDQAFGTDSSIFSIKIVIPYEKGEGSVISREKKGIKTVRSNGLLSIQGPDLKTTIKTMKVNMMGAS